MLVKITGDPYVLAGIRTDSRNGSNWRVDDHKPIGSAQQISNLLKILGVDPGNRGVGLPAGYRLYKGLSRDVKGPPLRMDKPPVSSSLHPNDYIYVAYEPEDGESVGEVVGEEVNGDKRLPKPTTAAEKRPPQRLRRRHLEAGDGDDNMLAELLREKQNVIENLGERLQAVEGVNRDLKRQVLQLTTELSMGEVAHRGMTPLSSNMHNNPPSPVARQRSLSDEGRERTSYEELEAASRLTEENKKLQGELGRARVDLRDAQLRLETLEAWKGQHDCSKTNTKTSDLRQEISQMKNTLRDVVREREETKEGLAIRRRELDDRFHSQRRVGDSLMKESGVNGISGDGAQLMPAPYYMDPHTAPASVYQQGPGRSEGTVCKLKVQTLTGEGTVVRRIYSAVTRSKQHVIILSSLEGVVTDEIVALELEKAGVGYNRPDLLFLATAKHRWVLSMEPEDRKKWLDWLVQTNSNLTPQQPGGGGVEQPPRDRQTLL